MMARLAAAAAMVAILCTAAAGDEDRFQDFRGFLDEHYIDVHGFLEALGGARLRSDPYQRDASLADLRIQLQILRFGEEVDFAFKGEMLGDLVLEERSFDLRELSLFARPADWMDLKVGRQILTWGTGDLLFINDLFPKDWQSFFIGRDDEYLKAPSDAVKLSLFGESVNLDLVYTPQFDADTYISGERLSYYNPALGRLAGRDAIIYADRPDRWFRDDEIAARLYGNVGGYELALYGYDGFWKSPAGQNPLTGRPRFPDLRVYGASARGVVGQGIGNVEVGYYQSLEDESGTNPNVNNSEMRYLVGYSREIARDLTLGLQYYMEQMLQYSAYERNLPPGMPARRQWRDVITVRLTQLMMNQNLTLSLFNYYSPADADVYMRPQAQYKVTDNLTMTAGANVFFGKSRETFFGQFKNNTNVYAGVRYNF